jgi:hypothetical protein
LSEYTGHSTAVRQENGRNSFLQDKLLYRDLMKILLMIMTMKQVLKRGDPKYDDIQGRELENKIISMRKYT